MTYNRDIIFLFENMGEFDDCPLEITSSSEYFKFLPRQGDFFCKDFFDNNHVDLTEIEQGGYDYFNKYHSFVVSRVKFDYSDHDSSISNKTQTSQFVKYIIELTPQKR